MRKWARSASFIIQPLGCSFLCPVKLSILLTTRPTIGSGCVQSSTRLSTRIALPPITFLPSSVPSPSAFRTASAFRLTLSPPLALLVALQRREERVVRPEHEPIRASTRLHGRLQPDLAVRHCVEVNPATEACPTRCAAGSWLPLYLPAPSGRRARCSSRSALARKEESRRCGRGSSAAWVQHRTRRPGTFA